jgi:hypothetical protein
VRGHSLGRQRTPRRRVVIRFSLTSMVALTNVRALFLIYMKVLDIYIINCLTQIDCSPTLFVK